MLLGARMFARHLPLNILVGFLRPLHKHRTTQLAHFLDHSIFGLMRITSITHRLLKRVDDLVQSLQ